MRGYKALVQEAELMAMPPELVADFLKQRAGKSAIEIRYDDIDHETETSLLGRAEPLINFALARYGKNIEVVRALFNSATPNSPVRLCCLINRVLSVEITDPFPVSLVSNETHDFAQWLKSATHDERSALFANPTLSDTFLADLLERRNGWESVDEDDLCKFTFLLSSNTRMQTAYADDWMDGFSEYTYSSVFDAAWRLAETVPTTDKWALSLAMLFENLKPESFSIKNPLELASRWQVDTNDKQAIKHQLDDHKNGQLCFKDQVRKGLARLALDKNRKILTELLESDDAALRAAAYRTGQLRIEQLKVGFDKDGALAFNEAVRNQHLWRNQSIRQQLRDIAWAVVDADKHADLFAANVFNSMERTFKEEHPEWFADEDDEVDYDNNHEEHPEGTTNERLSSINDQMTQQTYEISKIQKGLDGIFSRTGWIWWFSLGAFVASSFPYL